MIIKKINSLNKKQKVITLFVVLLALVGSALLFISSRGQNFSKNNGQLQAQNETVAQLLKLDTDKDGITDWEEALWGTDKTKPATFGIPDLEYIEQRKESLNIEQVQNDKALNETEQFAREFFASYTALRDSGKDGDTMNNFSSMLGEKISDPTLPDKYTMASIKTTKSTGDEAIIAYYSKIENIFSNYSSQGLGDEVDIVSSGLVSYDQTGQNSDYQQLFGIGEAYKNFAEEAAKIPVPEVAADYHLRIINNAYNTGLSVINMTKVVNDPIVGISGLSQYDKYSHALTEAVADLETFLTSMIISYSDPNSSEKKTDQ